LSPRRARTDRRPPLGRREPIADREPGPCAFGPAARAPLGHDGDDLVDAARRHRDVERRAFRDALGPDLEGRRLPRPSDLGEHGLHRRPGVGPGQLTVPTVFSTAENDFTSPPGPIIVGFDQTRQAGTPTELYVSRERRLTAAPYLRIPGMDQAAADEVVRRLEASGVWSADGTRIVADD
jgi:hypothetical protein